MNISAIRDVLSKLEDDIICDKELLDKAKIELGNIDLHFHDLHDPKIAKGDAAIAIELTEFIKHYKPTGWTETLSDAMHCPIIMEHDIVNLQNGVYDCFEKERYKNHFIMATKEFFSKDNN